jgi:hypothetical protein
MSLERGEMPAARQRRPDELWGGRARAVAMICVAARSDERGVRNLHAASRFHPGEQLLAASGFSSERAELSLPIASMALATVSTGLASSPSGNRLANFRPLPATNLSCV